MNRTTPRTARKAHRCECGARVAPGDRYLLHVISPHHDDIGNEGWWRAVECADCTTRYGRSALLAVAP